MSLDQDKTRFQCSIPRNKILDIETVAAAMCMCGRSFDRAMYIAYKHRSCERGNYIGYSRRR